MLTTLCRRLRPALLVPLAALPAPALAQLLDGVELEGPISGIGTDTITVMGITVQVPGGRASTPTNPDVPLADLDDPLPGRPEGFMGGTAIVEGRSEGGAITAATVFSDVNENVVGEATATDADPGTLHVNGLEMRALADPRIPAGPPLDGFGFEIDRATIPAGGAPPPAAGRVQVQLASGTPVTGGFVALQPDAAFPGFATYRFRTRDAVLAACPGEIKVVLVPLEDETVLAATTAPVEVAAEE